MNTANGFGVLVLGAALAACSNSGSTEEGGSVSGSFSATATATVGVTTSAGSGGAGGAATGSGGGTGGTGGQASVLGTTYQGGCASAAAFGTQCRAEGGSWDYCNSAQCTGVPMGGTTECYPPPPAPTQGEFACAQLDCTAGQVCVYDQPLGDGCASHACKVPPAPCDVTPTCACILAHDLTGLPSNACTEDSAGNATLGTTGDPAAGWP